MNLSQNFFYLPINKLGLSVFLCFTIQLHAQYVADNAVQWYNWTDDDTRHYVYEMGKDLPKSKTAVVLHGGWGAEHSYLIEPLEPLSDQYRFILYDQRGSLRSPAPEESITLDRFVEDLEDLRQTLALEKLTLIAHSMGNHLAYAYLSKYPDKVEKLILVAPVFPTPFGNNAMKKFMDEVWPEGDLSALTKKTQQWKKNLNRSAKKKMIEENILPDSLMNVDADKLDIYNIGEDKQRTMAWRIFFTAANACSLDNWENMRGGQVFYDQNVANAITSEKSYAEYTKKFWPAMKAFNGEVHVIIGTCDFVDLGPDIWPNVIDDLKNGHIEIIQDAGHNAWMTSDQRFREALNKILKD